MKATSGDNQNESTGEQWPRTLKINRDEFQQCYAVANLAVKLCELKKANSRVPLEKENLEPQKFLGEAWKLIEKAREHVSRPQSNAEYLADQHGSHEAGEKVVGRIFSDSRVSFNKLCNKAGGSETIHGVEWKVYRFERDFYDLFQTYWRYIGEQWKAKRIAGYSEAKREEMATLARDTADWEKRSKALFDSWKTSGVPANDFRALASGYFDFERGVKVITGENRPERALPLFRAFLKSISANEDRAEKAMAEYRKTGFASSRSLFALKDEFAKWRTGEVSRKRSEARGKRGRVKSKSDKRLGGRSPA